MYLQLKSINKSFADTDKETIKDVSLDIKKGEFICIVGPSGCGKSTLLNLVAGFIKPTSGEIILDGSEVKEPGSDRVVMFQEPALYPWLNVMQNVTFGLEIAGYSKDEQKKYSRTLSAYGSALEIQGLPYSPDIRRNETACGACKSACA